MNKFNQIKQMRQKGFTLLELLVVIALLAIIGGATISALDGFDTKAAQGTATHTIAAVEEGLRIYEVSEARLPNNLESLVCLPVDTTTADLASLTLSPNPSTDPDATAVAGTPGAAAVAADTAYVYGGESDVPGIGGGIGKKLAGKFTLTALTATQADALVEAGITNVRYGVASACDNNITSVSAAFTANAVPAGTIGAGSLVDMDIPNQAFNDPRPASATTFNQGRSIGFSFGVQTGAPVLVWNEGTGGYNDIKVGGTEANVLIALGVGGASDAVGNETRAPFSKAPFYGQIGKDKYAHYVALVDVAESPASLVAVVDARGDFLDEEIAEFSGQKN